MDFLTPADLLAEGLKLPLPDWSPDDVPEGSCCSITGQPIRQGYKVADITSDATGEFLDCFRGGLNGWVSVNAARCFKSSNPRQGNPCARSVIVFEDDVLWNPLVDQNAEDKAAQDVTKAEAKLAELQAHGAAPEEIAKHELALGKLKKRIGDVSGRGCWSQLVRSIWPERKGQQCLVIFTTDTKKRLWIKARVGALGSCVPVLIYDSGSAQDVIKFVNWPRLIECLDVVEEAYSYGFAREIIRRNLFISTKIAQEVGIAKTREMEKMLSAWRRNAEFALAVLISQKHTIPERLAPVKKLVAKTQERKETSCQLTLW